MGFLLSLAYNINRYMLEHKVLTNLLARLAFILLQEKYHAYFPFILRVNLLEHVECERTMTKNSQISEKEWFFKLPRKMGHAVFNKRKGFG